MAFIIQLVFIFFTLSYSQFKLYESESFVFQETLTEVCAAETSAGTKQTFKEIKLVYVHTAALVGWFVVARFVSEGALMCRQSWLKCSSVN